MNLHKLLQKQLSKYLPETLRQHPDLQRLLIAVNDSYYASERDKELADRAFTISEEEYVEINDQLKHEVAIKRQSVEKLKETIGTITGEEKGSDSDDLLMITRYLNEQVNKRKEAEEELKASQELWQFALEGAGDGVWRYDMQTGEVFYSKQYKAMLGCGDIEFDNDQAEWLRRIHPDDIERVAQSTKDYQDGKISAHQREYRIKHKSGEYLWVLDRGMILSYTEDGHPKQIVGTHTSITTIKQTEIELEQRAKQFKSLSENIPGVIYEYEFRKDGTEGLRYVSPAMEKIFGIEEGEFYQFQQYIHPDDLPEVTRKNKQSRETLEAFYDESRLVIPGRGIIWHSVTSSFSYYTSEGAAVFTGFMLDITERKNADQALKINEEKYRNIIANMNLGLLEIDNQEIIRSSNQSFCEMSGYTMDDLIGRKTSELFIGEENQEMMERRSKSREKGVADTYEIAVKNKNGESKWWLISGAPRFNDKGELLGSIGIHLDITQQKMLEYELMESREQAEYSATAKQHFLANMSHEIRTPMNAILGMSRQLQKTVLNEKQQLFLNTINNAGENLMVIINDILDISKIEAGKLALEKIGFRMKEVMKNTLGVMQHRAEEKGLVLKYSIHESIADILTGDPFRLNQVLLNLVSNAVKFSEKGTIHINCAVVEEKEGTQSIKISVIDNGIGMEKEFLNNLFQSFTQEDRSVSRKYGGTGLGMAITKQLAELMGGSIAAESEKNIGTTINLTIPFETGNERDLPQQEIKITDTAVLKGTKILLVEDNRVNRLVATYTLGQYGADITEVVNGIEAVEAVKKTLFDLVLMDVQMPLMDGLEATRIIRTEVKSAVPIIALTANAIKGENDKCIGAGMNAYVSKPFKEEELVSMIAKWLDKKVSTGVLEKPIALSGEFYDLSNLYEISNGDDAFPKKIITIFIEDAAVSLEEILTAVTKQDFATIKAVIHRIRPAIDSLGIFSLKDNLTQIETLAQKNLPSDELDRLIAELDCVLKKTIESLQSKILTIETVI
jgi:two-component system, sensor histidine kinase